MRAFHSLWAIKQAIKRRDELVLELKRKGGAYTSKLTLAEFLDKFIRC